MMPIYKADRQDGLGEITGYLIPQDDSDTFAIVSGFNLSFVYGLVCPNNIYKETLQVSFDNGKSFIKLSDLEVHTCTDFKLEYLDIRMRHRKEVQPANNARIFTVITDKGR